MAEMGIENERHVRDQQNTWQMLQKFWDAMYWVGRLHDMVEDRG